MKIVIKGGRLLDPASGTDQTGNLYIAAGRIVGMGQEPDGFESARTIDATGKLVIPGLIDLAVRLREPGFEHRATLESEMQAALAGGVTSLVLPPDTEPALDEPGLVEMLKHRARQLHQANLYPLGAMTNRLEGKIITEMAELTEAGCIAFSQASLPLIDTGVLLRSMQYAKTYGYTLWLTPLEASLSKGVAASGPFASRLGLVGVPEQAETIALHTLFELQKVTGTRLHICRLSSAAGIALVRQAKAQGLPVTCDVSLNHLHLTDLDIGFFDSNYRLDPPLRGQRDRDAIRAGLADGTIDAVCSDHTPVDDDGKLMPFAEAEPGATGVELLFSLVVKWAQEEKLSLVQALGLITTGPAAILKAGAPSLPGCGTLSVGAPADIAIADADAAWTVGRDTLLSQSAHTPFVGYELPGKIVMTLVSGRSVWESV
ncbi:dihydroorotase [Advenella kashmirensis WT001]|uniref:Dihydroorotase n=2 Tax=Advenella TaxID=290425 RepID=A0A4Q7VS94_9BURK|nr:MULTISPECIES: dihydroorotase [Advenella]AFK61700.1 dihydroorotase [Advenella kashmirensis WT001]RZT99411.1 dihydroorotase [Advenella incenata]